MPSLETGGDGSESEASDGGSSEADDASDDNQVVEDGEASSDMQISDPQGRKREREREKIVYYYQITCT